MIKYLLLAMLFLGCIKEPKKPEYVFVREVGKNEMVCAPDLGCVYVLPNEEYPNGAMFRLVE